MNIFEAPRILAFPTALLPHNRGCGLNLTPASSHVSKAPPSGFSFSLQADNSRRNQIGKCADIISQQVWRINRERAVDYLNTRNRIYVVDGFAGWDKKYQIKVRVVCARAYHALFMRNMLIRPDRKDLEHFHPDYTIYNAGSFPANRYTEGMTSGTSVAINFAEKEMVILGTEYAGEMKKGWSTYDELKKTN